MSTRAWLDELTPRRLLPSLIAGLISGTITVTVSVAFAALIFSGDLSAHTATGIGWMLFGSMVISTVAALTSSLPGLVAGLQDSSAAVLAAVSVAIVNALPDSTSTETRLFTVAAAVSLSTLLTGTVFMLLGQFKLGDLIRFIPYPVIGGFLAGSGLLLVRGAVSVMTDDPGTVSRWIPGLVLAILLMIMLRRSDHYLVMPGMLLAAVGVFYMVLVAAGLSVSEAAEKGWLFATFPGDGNLWDPITPADLKHVDWDVVFKQGGNLATVVIVSTVTLLLNATGIELATRQDVALNRELKAAGISNLIAGLGGSIAGTHVLSETILAHRLGAKSRLVGLILAAICGIALFAGGSVLSYFPKPVLGGLLFFLGLEFLFEWVYKAWFKLPKSEYAIVVFILVAINVVGFLEGVGLGLICAVVLFIVSYSRTDMVRETLTGAQLRSNVVRPSLYDRLLREKGDWLYILKLQGFIFFGTSNRLFRQVQQRISESDRPQPHLIVCDFRLVTGLDASAILSFVKIQQLAEAHKITLVFSGLRGSVARQMENGLVTDSQHPTWRIFPDLDHALEWCEDHTLAIFEEFGLAARPKSLKQQLEAAMPSHAKTLMEYFVYEEVEAGQYLIRQGDAPNGMVFIEQGQVSVQLEQAGKDPFRLRKMNAGTVVGEMSTYLSTPASASVVTSQASALYYLRLDALAQMEQDHPEVASAFHRFMLRVVAERVAQTTDTLQKLT